MTKIDTKTFFIVFGLLLVGVFAGGMLFKDVLPLQAATGSRHTIETEWMQGTSVFDTSTTTTSQVATTTPRYLAANASTTVKLLTQGISDLRININAKSTTTPPNVTIRRQVIGFGAGDPDYYPVAQLNSNVATEDNYLLFNAATTSDATLSDSPIPRTSILLTNINAPELILDFGVDAATDLNVEFLKVIPN